MIAEIKKAAEEKMKKSVESLKVDFGKVRTGRATTGILDHVKVDYYGSPTLISQVANLTLVDAHTLGVQAYEKNMLGKIEKAIRDADLGLNPSNMGEMLRVPMPPLTEERRKELVKLVRGEAENGKVAIRNIRRDAIAMHARHFTLQRHDKQFHQTRNFFLRTPPVFRTEGEQGQVFDTTIDAGFNNIAYPIDTLGMAGNAWQETLFRPPPIAVHDDCDMARNFNGIRDFGG